MPNPRPTPHAPRPTAHALFNLPPWMLFVFCGLTLFFVLFFQLGLLPFVGADEPRYARIGQEMLESGDWVTPRLEGSAWLEKPPLLFWAEALSFGLLGVSEWTARLPVALLATVCILGMAWFAGRVKGPRPALLTLLILSTSVLFFAFGRFASTDMPLVAMFSISLLLAFLASRERSLAAALASGAALGLAVLAKGPVALILFAAILVCMSLLEGRLFWSLKQTAGAAALCLLVAAPWFWAVWRANGFQFLATFWVNHHLARFLTPMHRHNNPFWYYLPVILLGFYPWSFFLGSNLLRLWRARHQLLSSRSLDVFLWLWVLVPVGFFSMSSSKLAGYVLPVFPALALLAALEWDRYLANEIMAFRSMRLQLPVLGAVTLVCGLVLVFGGMLVYRSAWLGPVLAAPLVLGFLWGFFEFRRRRPLRLFMSLVGSMVVFAALAFGVAAPVLGSFHSAKELALAARPLVSPDEPLIQFRYFHHSAGYYTGYQTTAQGIPNEVALFDYLADHPQEKYYVLTKEHGRQSIEREIGCRILMRRGNLFLLEVTP